MDAFGPERYVPIVLTKRGERAALAACPPGVSEALTPMFVVPPVDWDFDHDEPKKSVEDHINTLPRQLVETWGTQPAFVDLIFLDDSDVAGGQHPLYWLTDQTAALGLSLVPVVSTDRTDTYLDAATAVIARDGSGVCLRLPIEQWPAAVGTAAIDELLVRLGTSASDAHLVLDLSEDVGTAARTAAAAELRALPYRDDWLSVTIAGTCMPATMPPGPGVHILQRGEWQLYLALLTLAMPLERVPSFGDYVIGGVSPSVDVDPKFMNISATLRYAAGEQWLVAKGGLWKGNAGRSLGAAAVPPVAALLTGHPLYLGDDHCEFERWLAPVAAGVGGSSPEVWRRHGSHHHLLTVTEQIATVHAP